MINSKTLKTLKEDAIERLREIGKSDLPKFWSLGDVFGEKYDKEVFEISRMQSVFQNGRTCHICSCHVCPPCEACVTCEVCNVEED